MYKAEQFQELTKNIREKNLKKQKKIQEDMKLVEDKLNDFYMQLEKSKDLGKQIPKYTRIHKVLEKEVIDELILNQGYFVDLDKWGDTRIYYSKEDFDNREKNDNTSLNDKQREFLNKTSKVSMGDYEQHTIKDKLKTKEYKNLNELYIDVIKELRKQGGVM